MKKNTGCNIIVTIGYIENPDAFESLVVFFENLEGDLDIYSYRALNYIPFAMGCLGSSGDTLVLNYLKNMILFSRKVNLRCTYNGNDLFFLCAQNALIGLALSGQKISKDFFLELKKRKAFDHVMFKYDELAPYLEEAINLVDRFENEERSDIFPK